MFSKNFYLFLFIFLTGFFAVGALVIPSELASRINVFFAGLLTIITLLYTVTTKEILDDSSKKRKIDFISRQLEELYYPLWERMKKYEEAIFCGQLKKTDGFDSEFEDVEGYYFKTKIDFSGIDGVDEFDETVDFSDFLQKRYLFEPDSETKEKFEDFVYNGHCSLNITSNDSYELCTQLKLLLKKDMESLELELNELTSNK